MDKLVTTETILDYLKNSIENKVAVSPSVWVDGAQKLVVLLGDEMDKLYTLQQEVARIKIGFLDDDVKGNVSKARLLTEATDEFREMQKQRGKVSRIEEMIRVAKLQARMKDNEYRNSNFQ